MDFLVLPWTRLCPSSSIRVSYVCFLEDWKIRDHPGTVISDFLCDIQQNGGLKMGTHSVSLPDRHEQIQGECFKIDFILEEMFFQPLVVRRLVWAGFHPYC